MGKSLSCCTQTWRLIFVILNILFTLIGLALVGVGIWLFVVNNDFGFITNSLYASPASLLIVAGVITVVISVVGIIGSLGMWYCVLIVYISFMVFVVIIQITAGILGAVFQENLRDFAEDKIVDAIGDYSINSSDSDENKFIDFIQEEFDCCGYSGPSNWLATNYYQNETNEQFPESCECTREDCEVCAPFRMPCNDSQASGSGPVQFVWRDGCNSSVIDRLEDNLAAVAGIGVAFGVFELSGVAIALALCICACMKKGKDDDYPVDEYVY